MILDAEQAGSRAGGPSFALRVRLWRAAFGVCWLLLAAWTPPPLHRWRRLVLTAFGARLAPGAMVYGSAKIWYPPFLVMGEGATLGPRVRCYNQAPVVIGAGAIVSQDATLCAGTHDYTDPAFQLVTRPITIEARCWIAAEAFVGPGVRVGEGAVLGARGVATHDLAPDTVHAGNPARAIKRRHMRERG
jgi:putative colanic acid biosynthesis acetyltransferase WcaF